MGPDVQAWRWELWHLQGSVLVKIRARSDIVAPLLYAVHFNTTAALGTCHNLQDKPSPPVAIRVALSVGRHNHESDAIMRLSTIGAGLIACLATNVAATALTYKLDANEKACFYTETKKDNEKIAFYFAV